MACSLALKIETMIRVVVTVLEVHHEEDGGTRIVVIPTLMDVIVMGQAWVQSSGILYLMEN